MPHQTPTPKNMLKTIIGLLGAALMTACAIQAADAPKIKVLLITGDDVNVHKWQEMSQATRDVLVASGKFDVRVCEDAGILDSASSLKRYDMVFLTSYNASTPTLSDTAKENLISFVKSGKGFAISHLASASYKEWDEFKNLCGRYWVMGKSGHNARKVFTVKIADKDHAITKGISDFDQDDELYAKLQGDAPINVLVTADSDFSNKTEPLAFTLNYGQGRVFHECFGHDGKAITNAPVARLIVNGCQWAATGKVE
jgi:type 1 glutamine amidotransferase